MEAGLAQGRFENSSTGSRAHHVTQQLKAGPEAFENKDTLNADLDVWLGAHRVSQPTLEDYTSLLKHHIRPALGKKKLSSIKPLDAQQVVNAMGIKRLSARTIHYTMTVLRSALRQAVKWGVLLRNPAEDLSGCTIFATHAQTSFSQPGNPKVEVRVFKYRLDA